MNPDRVRADLEAIVDDLKGQRLDLMADHILNEEEHQFIDDLQDDIKIYKGLLEVLAYQHFYRL